MTQTPTHLPHSEIAASTLEKAKEIVTKRGEMGPPAIFAFTPDTNALVMPNGAFNSGMYPDIWKEIRNKLPELTHIVVAQDTLTKTLKEGEAEVVPSVARANGDESVSGAIIIMVFDRLYGMWGTSTTYRKNAEGKMVFGDSIVLDGNFTSRIPTPWDGESFVSSSAAVN